MIKIDTERLIHSIKTAAACLAGYFLADIIGVSADQWIVITILVVMCAQLYVGSVIQKAYLRFLGTLIGCLIAAVSLTALGASNATIAYTLLFSSFMFSYIATSQESLSYAGTLGAVTTAIILLSDDPTITLAGERFLEISVGILIATLVSQCLLPISARAHLRRAQATTLEQIRDLYQASLIDRRIASEEAYQEWDEAIVKSILRQRQLAKESKNEPLHGAFDIQHFSQSLYCEKELLRAVTFMHIAFQTIQKETTAFETLPTLVAFNDGVIKALNIIIRAIRKDTDQPLELSTPDIKSLKHAAQNNTNLLSTETYLSVDGFIFSADQLCASIIKLARLHYLRIST